MVRLRHAVLGAIAVTSTLAHGSSDVDDTQKPMVLAKNCHHPAYKSHILSQSPLIIYLTDFLTPEERAHLIDIT
jgi:prolyl 4-hydroxylase